MEQIYSNPASRPASAGNFFQQVGSLLRILLIEQRVPGKCYQCYYNLLKALGFKTTTIRVGGGVTLKGYTECLSIAQEVWSKRVYDHADFPFRHGMVVVDIGANQGFFSLYAASKGATVYAFEPSSENFGLLTHNVAANPCGRRVKAFQAAVAGTKGTVTLFVGLDPRGEILSASASIMNANRGGAGVKSESVEATTLDNVLRDNRIDHCDFLKMDCEGAEYEILKNTSADTFSRIRRISMETHAGRGREAVDNLELQGFEILEFDDSQAGFIKARRIGPSAP